MRIERVLIMLCYGVGVYFTLGGVKSWLDPSRWEMLRYLLLPAIIVLGATRYWHQNHHARALDHLNRRRAGQPPS